MRIVYVVVGAAAAIAGGYLAYRARHHHEASKAAPEHAHGGPHVGPPRHPAHPHEGPHVEHIVPGAEVNGVFSPFAEIKKAS